MRTQSDYVETTENLEKAAINYALEQFEEALRHDSASNLARSASDVAPPKTKVVEGEKVQESNEEPEKHLAPEDNSKRVNDLTMQRLREMFDHFLRGVNEKKSLGISMIVKMSAIESKNSGVAEREERVIFSRAEIGLAATVCLIERALGLELSGVLTPDPEAPEVEYKSAAKGKYAFDASKLVTSSDPKVTGILESITEAKTVADAVREFNKIVRDDGYQHAYQNPQKQKAAMAGFVMLSALALVAADLAMGGAVTYTAVHAIAHLATVDIPMTARHVGFASSSVVADAKAGAALVGAVGVGSALWNRKAIAGAATSAYYQAPPRDTVGAFSHQLMKESKAQEKIAEERNEHDGFASFTFSG